MESFVERWKHLLRGMAPRVWFGLLSVAFAGMSTVIFFVDEAGARRPPLIAWLPDWDWSVWAFLAMVMLFVVFFEGTLKAAKDECARCEEAEEALQSVTQALHEARSRPREAIVDAETRDRIELAEHITRLSRKARDLQSGNDDWDVVHRAAFLKDQLSHWPEVPDMWRDFTHALSFVQFAKSKRKAEGPITGADIEAFFLRKDPERKALERETARFRGWLLMRDGTDF